MTPLSPTPTLDPITPATIKRVARDVHVVVVFGDEIEVRKEFPNAVIYPIGHEVDLDAVMKKHASVSRIDLLWIGHGVDHAKILQKARGTLKRTKILVVALGRDVFGDHNRMNSVGKDVMGRIIDIAKCFQQLGYDLDGTLVLQNGRAVIGNPVNRATLPPPEAVAPPKPKVVEPAVIEEPTLPVESVAIVVPPPEPEVVPVAPKRRCVSMARLGTMGQWGNQVVQYAFLRLYAKQYDLDYAVPKWVGQYLFGFVDPPIEKHLSPKQEVATPGNPHEVCLGLPIPPDGDEYADRDFVGWAQYDTVYYGPHREFIQSLYATPVEPQASRVMDALGKLRQAGDTIIGLHLRRGDSGRSIYPFTPMAWCLRWLHANWRRFRNPVLFISTEATDLVKHFSGYQPVTVDQLGIEFEAKEYPGYTYPFKIGPDKARQLDFFPDWFLLQNCHVLLASDSSFSMTAAWTSTVTREVWRPKLSLGDFELTDPYNMHFCNREHVDDFPGIPGTTLNDNPQFGWKKSNRPKTKAVPEDPETFRQWLIPPQAKECGIAMKFRHQQQRS